MSKPIMLDGELKQWCFLRDIMTTPEDAETYLDHWIADYDSRHSGPNLTVISDYAGDGHNGLFHPAEGSHTASKSEFRRWTKAHGCIEVGDQPMPKSAPNLKSMTKRDRVEAIKRSMGML